MTVAAMLAEAIAAARAGRREEARAALIRVLEADDCNEQAWLWLAGVMDEPHERRVCLENVLTINPANDHARQGLAALDREPLPEPVPTVVLQPEAAALTRPALPPAISVTEKLPAPQPPQASASSPGAPPSVVDEDLEAEEPCPYCGAVTLRRHRACPACRKRLMVRTAPRERRSIALTLMAAMYALGAVSALVGGGFVIFAVVGAAMLASVAGQELPVSLVGGVVAIVLVVVAVTIATTIGLFQRRRWAYIAHIGNLVLTALLTVVQILFASVLAALLLGVAGQMGESADQAGAMDAAGSLGGAVLCNVGVLVVWVLLTVLSYRDFYGPMARMTSAGLDMGGDAYNAGIKFRNAGMWYMAAYAWERAAHEAPKDATVQHAFGLACAQLKRYEQALTALRAAHMLRPADPELAADLALVERLAAR